MPLTPSQKSTILSHTHTLLQNRSYPKTICPSEIARALSQDELAQLNASTWRDTMNDIRSVIWELRESDEVEVLQKGELVNVEMLEDVRGPMRVRARRNEG